MVTEQVTDLVIGVHYFVWPLQVRAEADWCGACERFSCVDIGWWTCQRNYLLIGNDSSRPSEPPDADLLRDRPDDGTAGLPANGESGIGTTGYVPGITPVDLTDDDNPRYP